MLKNWIFTLKKYFQKLSIRAAIFAVIAVLASLAAVLLAPYVPDKFSEVVGGNAVESILSIMASSMLIVMTFALSTMISAYTSVAQLTTPRATELIIKDSRAQSAISIFLGSFIYSIVSIVALSTRYYGPKGRVILLMVAILVLLSVVVTVIRWVEELKNMGSVQEMIRKVENVTCKALHSRAEDPTFGCQSYVENSQKGHPIKALTMGHIQNIDINSLSEFAEKEKMTISILNDVGSLVHPKASLVHISFDASDRKSDENLEKKVRDAFSIGPNRTFQDDPRYGITVLSGIALKALSPGVNDPGTAIDVVDSLLRVLVGWESEKACNKKTSPNFNRLFFQELPGKVLVSDAFFALSQAGADHLEVVNSLNSAFAILKLTSDEEIRSAVIENEEVLRVRTKNALPLPLDQNRIESGLH